MDFRCWNCPKFLSLADINQPIFCVACGTKHHVHKSGAGLRVALAVTPDGRALTAPREVASETDSN